MQKRQRHPLFFVVIAAILSLPLSVQAATLDGRDLSPLWGLPFAGVLLSIALFPLFAGHFWHAHYGKIAALWGVIFALPFAFSFGGVAFGHLLVHALIAEYIPFIVLLAALYTVAGGICLHGKLHASPLLNTGMLALGAVLASLMGTTGAAMLLIRPLLRANEQRHSQVHVVVFFIFIVANAGGSLTPLGDPPLFLGFLKGVGFFWTTQHLLLPMLFVCLILLATFFVIDTMLFRRHAAHSCAADRAAEAAGAAAEIGPLWLDGKRNFFLLLAIVALVLMSGVWRPGVVFDIAGTPLTLQDAARDILLLGVLLLSLWITPRSARAGNQFDWAPIEEVAKLFAAIFLTIAPVITILSAGKDGAFAALLSLVNDAQGQPHDYAYFWATGILSGFLDNAPTYLVFFNTAGGDAVHLMRDAASTLTAISAGAVFMGALTYIGNAPNFMVKAIAEERGVAMPGFLGYMGWSLTILIPVFALLTWCFF